MVLAILLEETKSKPASPKAYNFDKNVELAVLSTAIKFSK